MTGFTKILYKMLFPALCLIFYHLAAYKQQQYHNNEQYFGWSQ
jgi:hypothetical protein